MSYVKTIFSIIFLSLISAPAHATAMRSDVMAALTENGRVTTHEYLDQNEVACLTLAAYHEALNQGERGQMAVVHVILNRIGDKRWPKTACDVVFQRHQFSFMSYSMRKLIPPADQNWFSIQQKVTDILLNNREDFTNGANHFFNPRLCSPNWRRRASPTRIRDHLFMRL